MDVADYDSKTIASLIDSMLLRIKTRLQMGKLSKDDTELSMINDQVNPLLLKL